ncbi:MAG: hypothetical protein ACKN9D_16890, partial [Actinomycetales bacterium]
KGAHWRGYAPAPYLPPTVTLCRQAYGVDQYLGAWLLAGALAMVAAIAVLVIPRTGEGQQSRLLNRPSGSRV